MSNFTIDPMFKPMIEKHGFAMCLVFDNDSEQPNFTHTISATTNYNAELIVVSNVGGPNTIAGIINEILEEEPPPNVIYKSKLLDVKPEHGDPESLNLKLIDVSGEKWLDQTILNRCDEFKTVYQILLGDKDNRLPDEAGVEDVMRQFYFKKQIN